MAKICCFIGHRKLNTTQDFINKLYAVIEDLIINKYVDTFLFGSKSEFNNICYEAVSKFKETYPYIQRIYVRAEYPYISEDYKAYLLERYEDTYYPQNLLNSGRAVYVKRNQEMIDKSDICVIYYDEKYQPTHKSKVGKALLSNHSTSGTKIAHNYALKKKKIIINLL